MKKNIRFMISFVLLVCTVFACSVPAFAVSNTIKSDSSTSNVGNVGNPSYQDIQNVGDQNIITLPTEYNSSYSMAYIMPAKGNYCYVFKNPQKNSATAGNYQPNGYEGTEATILSTGSSLSCIIYRSDDNCLHAGWISNTNLSPTYPGTCASNGNMSTQYSGEAIGGVDASWSGDSFVGTRTQYTILNQTLDNVLSLTINYQITARNGKNNVPGPRTVYVNDGSGWEEAGTFTVDKNMHSVHYTINFTVPTTVAAVASIPVNQSSEGFSFNQFIDDVIVAY